MKNDLSVTLKQGKIFNKFQKKLKDNLDKKNKKIIENFIDIASSSNNDMNIIQNNFETLLNENNSIQTQLINDARNYITNNADNNPNINKNVYVNKVLNSPSNNYYGCYRNLSQQNDGTSAMYWDGDNNMDINACQQKAVDGGYKFFGLQNADSGGNAQCLVSNDINQVTNYGEAYNTDTKALWSSGTSGSNIIRMKLTNQGQIVIFAAGFGNTSQVWSSPNDSSNCGFWGGHINPLTVQGSFGGNCVGKPVGIDCGRPESNSYGPEGIVGNLNERLRIVTNNAYKENLNVFSVPSQLLWASGDDPAVCCSKLVQYNYQCGDAPFKTGSVGFGENVNFDCSAEVDNCKSFKLSLQSDGNMCVYQGDNTSVWCTSTTGQQQQTNPDWVSSKGKYGVSYLTTGQTLYPGEWIGSDDGKLKLIMQTDGNLVLYTSTRYLNCNTINNNYYGGPLSNAVYELNEQGDPSKLYKMGFVDENGHLSEYPSSMLSKGTTYFAINNYDSPGNDLSSMPIQNSSVDACTTACNSNNDCNAFVFEKTSNNCWLKNSNAYPNTKKIPNNNTDLYMNTPNINNNSSCPNNSSYVDSIMWNQYPNTNVQMTQNTYCKLAKSINTEMNNANVSNNQLSNKSQIFVQKINTFISDNSNINNKLEQNNDDLKENIDKYNTIQQKIKESFTNKSDILNGILSDTDLVVLHENYSYIFWNILAIASVILTLKVINK
jgi:hypothetical protein